MDIENLKTPISVLENEIKLLKDNINWLNKKNADHQKTINGNNEQILQMDYVIKNMENVIELINKTNNYERK